MEWSGVEKAFGRAVALSFSKQKMMMTFPALVLCGVLSVFCRAVAFDASEWIAMSLAFLPILLSSGVLLALGVLLIRMHLHEVKGLSLDPRRLITGSIDMMMGTFYLSIPPVLVYLFLWMGLGFFFLLKEIPGIGRFFSVVFAFAPFLLIFGSLLLCLFNVGLLFFVAPATVIQSGRKLTIAKRLLALFQGQLLRSIALFLLALVPIGIVTGLLCLSAMLTNFSFLSMDGSLTVALEWFFIMLPFAALLTPAVVFFFNFAAESYQLLQPA
jgi:hypothetical protein